MAKKPAAGFEIAKVRNLGIIAHIDAGKTTTTEHLLFYAGVKHKLGGVDEGTTETDYDQEEQERGITIYSACVPFRWRDCTVNLIDTPGHVDFTAEVERSLRVLDGAVVVFDAQKGVEAQSETVWRQANKYGVPRLVFVNKMDVVGADFAATVNEIRERLECRPVPITVPIGAGSAKDSPTPFRGIIDLLEMRALFFDPADLGKTVRSEPIPEEYADTVHAAREELFNRLTENDEQDHLTSAYLEGREIPVATIRQVLREQTLRRQIQPVMCGSVREHIGIQPLLDAVTWYLPSPLDRPPVVGQNPKKPDKEERRRPDVAEPFCGLVFKVVSHPNGDRFFVRVYSGALRPNSRPLNSGRDVKELVPKVYHVYADPTRGLEEIPEAPAGDIACVVGMRAVTGDTLCDAQHPILLEPIKFAEAVVSQGIEPESTADRDKLTDALNRLGREDPTFLWKEDKETGQTTISGMGMLHLEVKRHKLERDFRLKVRVGRMRVSFRETLRRPVTTTGEIDRQQVGGGRQFARVTASFTNQKSEPPVTVARRIENEGVPELLAAAAERGVRHTLYTGNIGGFPLLNVQAAITRVEFDPALTTEHAAEVAGTDAVMKAQHGNMVLLEPIMKLKVEVPDEFFGAVSADLTAHRAEIQGTVSRGKWWVIDALVPLREMFDYADRARSLSQGRASYSMEPHSYAPAPEEVVRAFTDGGGDY